MMRHLAHRYPEHLNFCSQYDDAVDSETDRKKEKLPSEIEPIIGKSCIHTCTLYIPDIGTI